MHTSIKRTPDTARAAYTIEETAQKLGVSVSHMWRSIKRQQIPSVRIGDRILIPRWWIDKLIFGGPVDPDGSDDEQGAGISLGRDVVITSYPVEH